MYASKSYRSQRTDSGRSCRYEHTSARAYVLRAIQRETDRELARVLRESPSFLRLGTPTDARDSTIVFDDESDF